MCVKNLFFLVVLIVSSLMGGRISYAESVKETREILLQLGSVAEVPMLTESLRGVRPATQTVTLIGEKRVPRPPPRQRNPKLSPDQLVVVGLDSKGQELSRTLVPDPRLIRAETLDPSDRLVSGQMYLENVNFSVVLPEDSALEEIRLYHPIWTGTKFDLELIGEIALP
ncbi:MAG: hypothetical protein WCH04_18645 [Gammaproteobacteria bacterium]